MKKHVYEALTALNKYEVFEYQEETKTLKIARLSERGLRKVLDRLPFRFNVYISNRPKTFVLNKKDIGEFLPERSYDNVSINVILPASNYGGHAPTPWIIIHRIMHSLFYDFVISAIRNFINEVYMDDNRETRKYMNREDSQRDSKVGFTGKPENDVMRQLFTFRSARAGKVESHEENAIEFMTQIVFNGLKVNSNMINLPPSIQLSNHVFKIKIPLSEASRLRDRLLNTTREHIIKELKQKVGKFIIDQRGV